jgi:hypothetical protein
MSNVQNGLKRIRLTRATAAGPSRGAGWLQKMSVSKVQVGQVWKKAGSDESFLVTRLYSEALTTFAVLRPAGKETAAVLRVKVIRKGTSQALPGFSMAQDSDEF